MSERRTRAREAARFVRARIGGVPPAAIIAGSGFQGLADCLRESLSISFSEIPHMPQPQVEGHAGEMILGRLAPFTNSFAVERTAQRAIATERPTAQHSSPPVLCFLGRKHVYEGGDPTDASLSLSLLAELGVSIIVLLSAAGGLNPLFSIGELVLLRDQICLPSFVRMTLSCAGSREPKSWPGFPRYGAGPAYDPELRSIMRGAAERIGVSPREGVYGYVPGPNYETRSEIGMLRRLGVDVVGMSAGPEVATARSLGLRVVGLSLVTNRCSESPERPILSHEEVLLAAGRSCMEKAVYLITDLVNQVVGTMRDEVPPWGEGDGTDARRPEPSFESGRWSES